MSYPLDKKGLRRDSQDIAYGIWFYETCKGLDIQLHGHHNRVVIPWRKLLASVKRKYPHLKNL